MPKLPSLSKSDKSDETRAAAPKAPRTSGGAGEVLAGLAGGPRGTWIITAIAAVITILLVLIIGFATRGIGAPGTPTANPGSTAQPTVTADTLLADMQGGKLSWNGTALTYGDPKVSVSDGTVFVSATFVDADVAMEQAVAVAKVAFAEPSITALKFESFNASGDRQVLIEFNAESTPVSTISGLESGTPQSAYQASANYSLSDDAYYGLDYTISQSGGTSPRP